MHHDAFDAMPGRQPARTPARTPRTWLRSAGMLVTLMAITLMLGACALLGSGGDAPAKAVDGALVGPNGMSLYVFDKDTAGNGKSVCNGQCAINWPPLLAESGEARGDYTRVQRDDGKQQWAYKGQPLYYWAKDQKPGDRTGDGFNKVWRLARP